MDKYKKNALSIARKPQSLQYTKDTSSTSIDEYLSALNYLEFLRDEYNYKGLFICNSEGVVKLSTEKRMAGKKINKGNAAKYFTSIVAPTHKKNIGAKKP